MKLLFSPTSPYARKVRIVIREIGITNIEEVGVAASPVEPNAELTRRNPLGKIPVLVLEDGSALYDSPVICEYLDSLRGGKLLPAGNARWIALRQQALADGLLDAAVLLRYETVLRPQPLRWPDWIEGQRRKMLAAVDALGAQVPSLAGDLTLGGISVACALGYLDFRFSDLGWREAHGTLGAWFETVAQRESIKTTQPPA